MKFFLAMLTIITATTVIPDRDNWANQECHYEEECE